MSHVVKDGFSVLREISSAFPVGPMRQKAMLCFAEADGQISLREVWLKVAESFAIDLVRSAAELRETRGEVKSRIDQLRASLSGELAQAEDNFSSSLAAIEALESDLVARAREFTDLFQSLYSPKK